jgi:Histidine kinase-, DNA gyrase B-, and HSP90-like ATPase
MTTFEIEVQDDHLQRISQVRKPLLAVAELIWNSVDADADRVDVSLKENALGGLEAIEISDNGHGIPHDEAKTLFCKLGGSWKQDKHRSLEQKRILHGKEGKGRFRAFALGRYVEWQVCYGPSSDKRRYKILMDKDHLRQVQVEDEISAPKTPRGVTVRISEFEKNFLSLTASNVADELAQIFALYLRQYPKVKIYYRGSLIDPRSAQERTDAYPLPDIATLDDGEFKSSIEIVEWRMPTERRLYFCDEEGFPLDETQPGVQAAGFDFTAYLKSNYFAKLVSENRLEIANLDAPTNKALTAAKDAMRAHFRRRASEKAAGLVEQWRREQIYPYEGEPSNPLEAREREVFNVVALSVNNYLPEFKDSDETSKRFQLRLLRQSIERAPADLAKILNEVLDLPTEKRIELAELLDRTTLSHIINASKIVGDRLDFLKGLETLVFDDEYKTVVRERTQLHRVVAENAWVFGEQYNLSVDDESLTSVLKAHFAAAGVEIEIDEPVTRADGSRGIVDLMFSRNIQLAGSQEREHLVVELKRPSVRIGADEITQIKRYAFAVADDERFQGVPAHWIFWVVSNEIDNFAKREIRQDGRPVGILHKDERVTIWIKTWSQIINDCRTRLQFFAEKLNYTPDRDSSIAHLQKTYNKYLSALFSSPAQGTPPGDAGEPARTDKSS